MFSLMLRYMVKIARARPALKKGRRSQGAGYEVRRELVGHLVAPISNKVRGALLTYADTFYIRLNIIYTDTMEQDYHPYIIF